MSRRRHPAGPVTVHRVGAEPELVPASDFRRERVRKPADADPPRLLRVGSGYTTTLALAIRDEREAVPEEWQDDRSQTVTDIENAATLAARETFTSELDRLEREIADLYKHSREHRLMTHRQYAQIRRALNGARPSHPRRVIDTA